MTSARLRTVDYCERRGQPLEWSITGLVFGQINLLVGKNATGKTRALNVIANLAKPFVQDRRTINDGTFRLTFSVGDKELRYELSADIGHVLEETVSFGGREVLRRKDTTLDLFYEKEGIWIKHECPPHEVSAATRKDRIQHPFLLPLQEWAESVRHYSFGSSLGKETLGLSVKSEPPAEFDDRDQNRVVGIFLRGKKEFKDDFVNALLNDMRGLNYPVSSIDAATPDHIKVSIVNSLGQEAIPVSGQLLALGVKEEGVGGMYYQDSISQGMFRALSILVQVNYSQMAKRANCILIDDIGEGLDFNRSSRLIELLRNKAKNSNFQLILATNDQFVMNSVPLDDWSLLQRTGNRVAVRNIENSKDIFEDFRFVGLSNFAFFEMDFANRDRANDPQLKLEVIK